MWSILSFQKPWIHAKENLQINYIDTKESSIPLPKSNHTKGLLHRSLSLLESYCSDKKLMSRTLGRKRYQWWEWEESTYHNNTMGMDWRPVFGNKLHVWMQFFMERHDQPKLGEKWIPREVNRMNGRSAQVTECKSIAREPSIYEGA